MTAPKVTWIELPTFPDPRGNLTVMEGCRQIPFSIARIYYLYEVPADISRGGHAHRDLQQVMVAVAGSFDVLLDDGTARETVRLDRPDRGLVIDRMVWHEMKNFSPGSICLMLASAPYDEADYFREYAKFLEATRAARGSHS